MSKSIKVAISPNIINWLLNTKLHDSTDNDTIMLLRAWLGGEKKPTLAQVRDLSRKLHVPFGVFFLEEAPQESPAMTEFRTMDSAHAGNLSQDLQDTIMKMLQLQDWMRDEVRENYGELSFVGCCGNVTSTDRIISVFREVFQVSLEWHLNCKTANDVFNLARKKCNQAGILVFMNGIVGQNNRRKLNLKEFRAFTLVDPIAPLIFINACDSMPGRIFSILHEMTHILLGCSNLYDEEEIHADFSNSQEAICNKVAAEILVPDCLFRKLWRSRNEEVLERIRYVSRFFKCSLTVVARKALSNDFINKGQYNYFAQLFKEEAEKYSAKHKPSGGNYYAMQKSRLDPLLLETVVRSIDEGKTSYTEAYRLTDTTRKTFDKVLAAVEGRGEQ